MMQYRPLRLIFFVTVVTFTTVIAPSILRAALPPGIPDGWSEGFVYANGIRIHYYHAVPAPGKPVIVMVHGVTDNGLCWTTLTWKLQRDYDIYMLDTRGHGLSDPFTSADNGDTLIKDVVEAVHALKLEKPILLGHSMGAATVMRVGAEYPDLARRIIMLDPLVGPGGFRSGRGLGRQSAATNAAASNTTGTNVMARGNGGGAPPMRQRREGPAPGGLSVNMFGSPETLVAQNNYSYDELVAKARRENPMWDIVDCQYWALSKKQFHGAYGSEGSQAMNGAMNTGDSLAKIIVPALILKAGADASAEIRRAMQDWVSGFKNVKLVYIDAAHHNLHHDQLNRTMEVLKDFLPTVTDGGGRAGASGGTRSAGGGSGRSAGSDGGSGGRIISYVDTSLNSSQRYVLRVDGKPFFLTDIQVRLDKLRYRYKWNATGLNAILAQVASDGFNTVSIPVMWYEIEPTKDNFNWTILDEYLGLCKSNNLKVELLWFSQNSGTHVQWLGGNNDPVHLRTPDYVLHSPSPRSQETTSEFKKTDPYTLDLNDTNLRAREAYVVAQMMAHIAAWDAANGSPHTVVGVQLGNEIGNNVGKFSGATEQAFYNEIGAAVKKSNYSVWTRMNSIIPDLDNLLNANEAARSQGGTYIDFVGVDLYDVSVAPIPVQSTLKETGKNFRMVMEIAAEVPNISQLSFAALSGGNAFDYYEACGTDGHGIYVQNGANAFKPRRSNISTIRTANHLLLSDTYDLAVLKPQSTGTSGFFVHNWMGDSTAATTGVRGVSFTPSESASQGISIARSGTEIVLMNTLGGTFTYPASLKVSGASRGAFDANNTWVAQGDVTFSDTSITPPAGTTVRLTVGATEKELL